MISYHQLCEIYRTEKSTNLLCELPKNFENEVKELVYSLNSKNDEQSKIELENIKNRIKELTKLRMQKIALAAFLSGKINTEIQKELEFFNELQALLKKQLKWIDEIEKEKKEEDSQGVTIKFLEDVEEYVTSKGKISGPYKKDQIIKTEKEEAEWLINAGFAAKIE
ncbi:MAG: hypothetical protein QXV64_00220 [Candidatus Anstonellaceae archaeon]